MSRNGVVNRCDGKQSRIVAKLESRGNMKASTVRRLIGTTLIAGVVGAGTIANASPSRETQKYTSICSALSGISRKVCDEASNTKNRAALASFLRIYGGPLESNKDQKFTKQLTAVYDALANRRTSSACISDIRQFVILETIRYRIKVFQAENLYNSWIALMLVLDKTDYATSLSDFGWRGPFLKKFFLDKIPSLTGYQKQWGEWAARNAFEFGDTNARRIIGINMLFLITNCQGEFNPK